MKMVVTSDWHADWVTNGFDRHEDVRRAVGQVVDYTKREARAFVFMGDLSNPFSPGVHRAVAFGIEVAQQLNDVGIPNLWLTGNHDVVEDVSGSHVLNELAAAGFECTTVVDRPTWLAFAGRACLVLPFTSLANDYDPVGCVRQSYSLDGRQPLVFGHLNIEGIAAGSETTDMPRGRNVFLPVEDIFERWPGAMVFNGHYHAGQTFRQVRIPGSPVKFAHGEEANASTFLVAEV